MPMNCVELTDAEKLLLAGIDFDHRSGTRDATAARAMGESACKLTKSLRKRQAIPKIRLQWFTDPVHNIGGRGKSRQGIFEKNGTRGEEILRHPHFLKYLRYFLYGPDLPAPVIRSFERRIADCGRVSSGDIIPLGKYARDLVRRHDLEAAEAAEEFYKLALECGLDASDAGSIRSLVRGLRKRR